MPYRGTATGSFRTEHCSTECWCEQYRRRHNIELYVKVCQLCFLCMSVCLRVPGDGNLLLRHAAEFVRACVRVFVCACVCVCVRVGDLLFYIHCVCGLSQSQRTKRMILKWMLNYFFSPMTYLPVSQLQNLVLKAGSAYLIGNTSQ